MERSNAATDGSDAFRRAGMSTTEPVRIHKMVRDDSVRSALGKGMGHGTSSDGLCAGLPEQGGRLTPFDPLQTTLLQQGFGEGGVMAVRSLRLEYGSIPIRRNVLSQRSVLKLA